MRVLSKIFKSNEVGRSGLLKFRYIANEMEYDGSQLRSLFAYRNYELLGDSLISWVGPCQVKKEFMVDGEDLNAGEKICGDKMLHFIWEKFNTSLFSAVASQRLMTCLALEALRELSPEKEMTQNMYRDGDDIYLAKKKLNISIATVSPVSALIHWALNIVNDGTPVDTLSLQDLKIQTEDFVEKFSQKVLVEMSTINEATQKVHWVK